jgi:O-antigen ligase
MPPSLAAVACGLLILMLFLLDWDPKARVSSALWIPVVWLSITASRPVALWLGVDMPAEEFITVEGNPLDARVFAGLLAAGLMVLIVRGRSAERLLRENGPLLAFLLYCLLSVFWSDYPMVTFKRWTKAFGDVVMVWIVLTDPEPTAAIKRLLARTGFLLIPVSILLIKYYPSMGRGYSPWTGAIQNTGAATQKNGLGVICLLFGLAFLWYLLEAFQRGERVRTIKPLIAHGATLAMAVWLFWMGDSATSIACFLMGGGLMVIAGRQTFARRPAMLHTLVGTVLAVILYGLFLNPGAGLVEAVGRDSTLTGRTALWDMVLSMTVSPWFGAGYESFWLGERLEKIWQANWWHPNQAHNGYIEVYLDLGWVGLALLALVIGSGYRNIVRALRWDPGAARLKLAFFAVAVAYNLTEHAFRDLHPLWIALLLAVTVVPEPSARKVA